MRHYTLIITICCGLLGFPALTFADDKQVATPGATVVDPARETAIFNRDKDIYNDKENKNFRAQKLVDKDIKSTQQNKKKVENEQDEKNGLNQKDGADAKNEQYDKQLTVKF